MNGVSVEFSESAPVQVPGGWWLNPFQRNSYTARVEFPDGFVACIALPPNARSQGQAHWFDRVLCNAALMHAAGVSAGHMVVGGNPEAPTSFDSLVERVERLR